MPYSYLILQGESTLWWTKIKNVMIDEPECQCFVVISDNKYFIRLLYSKT